ncbi:MAG: GTPase [Thermoanaerobaculia bacterium]
MKAAKVLVVGAAEAGKSTLVRVLTSNSVNLERGGRTVALDHGTLPVGATDVSLIGIPGQERFAAVREALAARAAGAVWVLAANRDPDPGTLELLERLGPSVPYVVLVNLRDGESRDPRFAAPAPLRPPLEVVAGDLLHDPYTRERLRWAISRLLHTNAH